MNNKYKDLSNAIRFLSIDAVEKANSGHPGLPMGMADVVTILFKDFLRFNPNNPNWINRDRFVLSAGHGSMLLYSLLYLTGYRSINIDDIKIQKSEEHTNKVNLDNELVMEMKYPSLDQFIKSNFDFTEEVSMDQSFDLIASCIDKIYNEEEVWSTADCTKKEVKDFLEQMNSMQFKEIEKFFETMPKLSHSVTFTNPKTKVESTVVLEGLSSFFA